MKPDSVQLLEVQMTLAMERRLVLMMGCMLHVMLDMYSGAQRPRLEDGLA